jgi:hypothetical protein
MNHQWGEDGARCVNCGAFREGGGLGLLPCSAAQMPEEGQHVMAVAKAAMAEARRRYPPGVEVLVIVYKSDAPEAQSAAGSDTNRGRAARALGKLIEDLAAAAN